LRVLVVPGERHRGRGEGDRSAARVPRERTGHSPDGDRDDDDRDELEHAYDRHERAAQSIEGVGEDHHEDGRREREAEPRQKRTERSRAEEADRNADLAARWTRKRLTQRDEIRVGGLVDPVPAHDVLATEVPQMSDRPTERREPEPQRDEEDLERR